MARSLRSVPSGRLCFGLALGLAWAEVAVYLSQFGSLPKSAGQAPRLDLSFMARPGAVAALTVLYAAAWIAFMLRRRQAWAGWTMFFLLALGDFLFRWQWPVGYVTHAKLLVAASLAAYLAAYGYSSGTPAETRETRGREAACGPVAAAYLLAGLSKLRSAGWAWGRGTALPLLIAERSFEGPALIRFLRLWIAGHPGVCALLATGALCIELSGVVFVWPPARRPWAAASIGMHLGILLTMGYSYLAWMMLTASLAFLPWRERNAGA